MTTRTFPDDDRGNPAPATRPATGARARVLGRVQAAVGDRAPVDHPGAAPETSTSGDAVAEFSSRLVSAGGEVVLLDNEAAVAEWLTGFVSTFGSAAVSRWLPAPLRPRLPEAPPEEADLGVSLARAAAAECGTILLDSTEGRRLQLLPPVHLVWLPRSAIAWSLRAALMAARLHHGAALGLHSGPSKSADIGGVLVRGVHGPGRLVAALVPEGVFRTGDGQDSRDDR